MSKRKVIKRRTRVEYASRQAKWQAQRRHRGLCPRCGQRERATNPKTGLKMSGCLQCLIARREASRPADKTRRNVGAASYILSE